MIMIRGQFKITRVNERMKIMKGPQKVKDITLNGFGEITLVGVE